MPIMRTYGCESCNYMMTVELNADQWDAEAPECPACANATYQEFSPPGIVGSVRSKAVNLALDIAEKDYGVADIQADGKPEGKPKVRFKDVSPEAASSWAAPGAALAQAVTLGRETRIKHGNGLDIIKTMPDLIALSKRRSMRVW